MEDDQAFYLSLLLVTILHPCTSDAAPEGTTDDSVFFRESAFSLKRGELHFHANCIEELRILFHLAVKINHMYLHSGQPFVCLAR
jgi:hypothetical protein